MNKNVAAALRTGEVNRDVERCQHCGGIVRDRLMVAIRQLLGASS